MGTNYINEVKGINVFELSNLINVVIALILWYYAMYEDILWETANGGCYCWQHLGLDPQIFPSRQMGPTFVRGP